MFRLQLVFLLAYCSEFTSLISCEEQSSLSVAVNEFSFKLYDEISRGNPGENVFFSPLSISSAFSIILVGAKGDTENQLKAALSLDKGFVKQSDIDDAFEQLLSKLPSNESKYIILEIANRLLVQEMYQVLKSYNETVIKSYQSQVNRVDFKQNLVIIKDEINNWVSTKTRGMIKEVVSGSLSPSTSLMILNVVYFKGQWIRAFRPKLTRKGPFYAKETNDNVDFMLMNNTYFKYFFNEEKKYQMLEMHYIGTFSMIVILPEDKQGLEFLAKSISLMDIEKDMKQMNRTKVMLKFPKFNLKVNYDLNLIMSNLGAKDAFDPSRANFSGISGHRDLFVSKAIHDTVLEVNERGTQAAAVTRIATARSALRSYKPEPLVIFVADHPFLFFIRENTAGTILFMGHIFKL